MQQRILYTHRTWQFIEINCICVFDVCLRSTKLIESTFAEHSDDIGDIGLKLNRLSTIRSCHFCSSPVVLVWMLQRNDVCRRCMCTSLRLSSASIELNICVSISTHKLHLHVHIKLHDVEIVVCVCVFVCLCDGILRYICLCECVYKFEQVLNMKLILTSSHERAYETWYYIIYLNIVLLLHTDICIY